MGRETGETKREGERVEEVGSGGRREREGEREGERVGERKGMGEKESGRQGGRERKGERRWGCGHTNSLEY